MDFVFLLTRNDATVENALGSRVDLTDDEWRSVVRTRAWVPRRQSGYALYG
jgi:hypothetical protein